MDDEHVYPAKRGLTIRTSACLVGGLLLVAMGIGLTILAAQVPSTPGQDSGPGFNRRFLGMLLPTLTGVFLVLHGGFLLRTTRRVFINRREVRVDGWLSRRDVAWEEIARIDRATRTSLFSQKPSQALEIRDGHDRIRAVILDTVEGFEQAAQEIIDRSSAAARKPTYVAEESQVRQEAKQARQIRWAAWGFLLFTLGMAAGLAVGIHEEVHLRRLAAEGVEVDAKVERAWMVRVTPRVEYSFADETGRTHTREAMMYQGPDWDKVKESETVRIVYLPSAPQWNRLLKGEDAGPQFGGKFLFVTGGGVIMFGLFTIVAMKGYDLKVENDRVRLLRRGQIIREWGKSRNLRNAK